MNFLKFHQQYGGVYLNKPLGTGIFPYIVLYSCVSTINTDCQHWEFVTDPG